MREERRISATGRRSLPIGHAEYSAESLGIVRIISVRVNDAVVLTKNDFAAIEYAYDFVSRCPVAVYFREFYGSSVTNVETSLIESYLAAPRT